MCVLSDEGDPPKIHRCSESRRLTGGLLGLYLLVFNSLIAFIAMDLPSARAGEPTYVGGHVGTNTTWSVSSSPYVVFDNITVDQGVMLIIDSGVEVRFNYSTSLVVDGSLYAVGDPLDRILFTANKITSTRDYWAYIKFTELSDDNISKIENAKIEHAAYGIWCSRSSPVLTGNVINEIGSRGIYLEESNSSVTGNVISNVSNIGIDITYSEAVISKNLILDVSNYAIVTSNSVPIIENNSISRTIEGIYSIRSFPKISHNNITTSGDSIRLEECSRALLLENFLMGGQYGLYAVHSSNVSITLTMISNADFGIYAMASNMTIENSTVTDIGNRALYLTQKSRVASTNTTFDDKLLISGGSTLVVSNFLFVRVERYDGSVLENVIVEIQDNGLTLPISRTGPDGYCRWLRVTDRVYENSDVPKDNITSVKVTYDELVFSDNPRDVDMSASHTEIFNGINRIPFIYVHRPVEGEILEGNVTVNGTSRDDDGSVILVEVQIDNSQWFLAIMDSSNWSDWSCKLDTTHYSDGNHIITVKATDNYLDNSTISVWVYINNVKTQEISTLEDISLLAWAFFIVPFLAAVYVLIRQRKRRKKEVDDRIDEDIREDVGGHSREVRIEVLNQKREEGLISEEIYRLNLDKLETTRVDSFDSSQEGMIAYVCPECDTEVDVDATKCPNCGAVFQE